MNLFAFHNQVAAAIHLPNHVPFGSFKSSLKSRLSRANYATQGVS